LAAEGQLSLAEAEYRVMVAKAWDTPRGKPTLAGNAELELSRLRMRLVSESAKQIEHDVRVGLAEEAFSGLDARFLDRLPTQPKPIKPSPQKITEAVSGDIIQSDLSHIGSASVTIIGNSPETEDPYEVSLKLIGRAIRLDNPTALNLFLTILPPSLRLDLNKFGKQLIEINRVWNYQDDRDVFEWFLTHLAGSLGERESNM
jgi:hypothetical protein